MYSRSAIVCRNFQKIRVAKVFPRPDDNKALYDFPDIDKQLNHAELFKKVTLNLKKPTVMSRQIMKMIYPAEAMLNFTATGVSRDAIPEKVYDAVYCKYAEFKHIHQSFSLYKILNILCRVCRFSQIDGCSVGF